MTKLKAVIVGDTKNFHIGSYVNCSYLYKTIEKRYKVLGLFGAENFHFATYDDFLAKIKNFTFLYKSIESSDIIFCHGEGMIEPNSMYGDALFYLAAYIRRTWPSKKIYLINFSCFDKQYGNWNLFDMLIPRDQNSLYCLKKIHPNVQLGFDCSILQNININNIVDKQRDLVLVFRGRKDISVEELEQLQRFFDTKKVLPISAFWEFGHSNPVNITSLPDLQSFFRHAYLAVSSSFHGIVFSTRFGVPFIPIATTATKKNESVATDVLKSYYKKRDLHGWLKFYANNNNYHAVSKHLNQVVPELQERALIYSRV